MNADDTINLIRYLQIIQKRKMLIVVIAVISAIAAIVVTLVSPKTYSASAVVQLSDPQRNLWEVEKLSNEEKNLRMRRSASNLVEIAISDSTLRKVASKLGLKAPISELRAGIQPNVAEAGNFMTVTVQQKSPQRTALVANALADLIVKQTSREDHELKEFLLKRLKQLRSEIVQIEERKELGEEIIRQSKTDLTIGSAERILAEAQALQALSSLHVFAENLEQEKQRLEARLLEFGDTKISKAAEVPRKPNEHPLSFNIAFALILGVTGGVAVALLKELWQRPE